MASPPTQQLFCNLHRQRFGYAEKPEPGDQIDLQIVDLDPLKQA